MKKKSLFIFQMIALGLAIALILIVLFPGLIGKPTPVVEVTQEPPPQVSTERVSYADAVSRAAPAVVNIYTAKTVIRESHPLYNDPLFKPFFRDPRFAPRLDTQTSLGSGVIISPQGYILTSNHVIANADEIAVLLRNGQQLNAKAIGSDPETDLAVLKVEEGALPSISVGSSADLMVGDVVLAIGNPFGVGQTVTQGIISATGRNQLGLNTFEDFIQTDAAINPGNSGGALVNAYGQLVGINTAIFSRSGGSHGIGFAIPVNLARDVMTQIIENGQVVRGWLGVEGVDISPALAEKLGLEKQLGVLLTNILEEGPAETAGLKSDDVLLEIDGSAVEDVRSALNLIARSKPGDKLKIRGLREGKFFETEALVSVRPLKPTNGGSSNPPVTPQQPKIVPQAMPDFPRTFPR